MRKLKPKITDLGELVATICDESDAIGISPGDPGWMLFKFVCDTLTSDRLALVLLLELEPTGAGLMYVQHQDLGWFKTTEAFVLKHGYGFEISHPEYRLDRLNDWFMITTDGCWNRVFLPAS